MIVKNSMGLPQSFVEAVSVDRHNEPGHYSATTLNKGIKEIVLIDRHWDELVTDAAENVWAVWRSYKTYNNCFNLTSAG